MLLTLTCAASQAPDIGYLLGKHPDTIFQRAFSAGQLWVFYPEVAAERVTVALLAEVDPIDLVRHSGGGAHLDQYVNDRPYVASSLMSVAIHTAFTSALAGHCAQRPEMVEVSWAWEVHLPAVPCTGDEGLFARLFAPLGYTVAATPLPLDTRFPEWGPSALFDLRLKGTATARDLLCQLYVLLPVLDNAKHYFVGEDEARKLVSFGGAWLAAHPERDFIARRYLRHQRDLMATAQAGLATLLPEEEGETSDDAELEAATIPDHLHDQRLEAVIAAVRAVRAVSLADLGCGEGRLVQRALAEPHLERIFAMDVSPLALARARARLRWDELPAADAARLTLTQGSLLYRDRRLEGFDAAALVEVIEHLDPPRLAAMEQVIFALARPGRVIITTPNREWNARFTRSEGQNPLRHEDHRFEWTRAEGRAWAAHVAATFGYRAQIADIGTADPLTGPPTQLLIFDRVDEAGEGPR